jgi:AhpD family alkylhydroperoxidase
MFACDKSRIRLLDREDAPREVHGLYDNWLRQWGAVPNLFKVLGYTPRLAEAVAGFLTVLTEDGALPGWYKELIAARIAILHRCGYSYASHTALARQKGASEDQLAALQFYERGPFSSREKRGFRFADQVHRGPRHVDESLFDLARQYFTVAEIVELTTTASAVEYFTRFVAALRIPVTPASAAALVRPTEAVPDWMGVAGA